MRYIRTLMVCTALAASAASATAPTYFTPADVLARLSQFDGQHVAVGGSLQAVNGTCLSLGDGIWAGRFSVAQGEARRLRALQIRLTGRFVIVEGTLRAGRRTDAAIDPHRCNYARIEGVTIREAAP